MLTPLLLLTLIRLKALLRLRTQRLWSLLLLTL